MDFPFQQLFIRSNKLDKSLTDLVVWVRLRSQRSDFLDPIVAAIHTSGVATRVTEPSSLEAATLVRLTFPYTTTPQHSLPSNCAVACRKLSGPHRTHCSPVPQDRIQAHQYWVRVHQSLQVRPASGKSGVTMVYVAFELAQRHSDHPYGAPGIRIHTSEWVSSKRRPCWRRGTNHFRFGLRQQQWRALGPS